MLEGTGATLKALLAYLEDIPQEALGQTVVANNQLGPMPPLGGEIQLAIMSADQAYLL
jgi:hypothetical protein